MSVCAPLPFLISLYENPDDQTTPVEVAIIHNHLLNSLSDSSANCAYLK